MSIVVSVPETIAELTTLVQAGDIPAARKLGKKLINKAETRELWLIAKIADLLDNRPRTAVDILRQWWASAPTDADRAIIAACAPKNGEQRRPQSQTGSTGRRDSRSGNRAPSTVKTEQSDDLRRRRRTRQELSDAAAFANYQTERAGVAEGDQIPDRDEREQATKVYASGFDYDRAALYGTDVAFRCLSCSISRGRYDLPRDRMTAGHGDDGLCAGCRESGRPGIPELPTGHSLSDAVTARCLVIQSEYGTDAARAMLRAEWRQVTMPAVRAAIADYVAANLPAEVTTSEPAQEPATAKPAPKRRKPATPTPETPEAPAEETGTTKPAARKRRPATPAEALARKAEAGKLQDCHGCNAPRGDSDVNGLTVDDGQCGNCRELTDHLAEQEESATLPACGTCGQSREPRDVRHLTTDDGQCAECRELDYGSTEPAA